MEAFRSARPDLDDALDLEAFEATLHGSIVLPGSPDYDLARQGPARSSVHRSRFLSALDDDAIDALLAAMSTPSLPAAVVQLRVLGGAMATRSTCSA